MTIEGILSKMKAIYIERDNYVDEDLLTPKVTAYDLCMDSLDCVEFVMECEKEFNIAIPEADFECVKYAEELAEVIKVILDKQPTSNQSPSASDFRSEETRHKRTTNMATKNLAFIIFVAVALYCSVWLFNHINAWIGIAAFVLILYMVAAYILHKINKK